MALPASSLHLLWPSVESDTLAKGDALKTVLRNLDSADGKWSDLGRNPSLALLAILMVLSSLAAPSAKAASGFKCMRILKGAYGDLFANLSTLVRAQIKVELSQEEKAMAAKVLSQPALELHESKVYQADPFSRQHSEEGRGGSIELQIHRYLSPEGEKQIFTSLKDLGFQEPHPRFFSKSINGNLHLLVVEVVQSTTVAEIKRERTREPVLRVRLVPQKAMKVRTGVQGDAIYPSQVKLAAELSANLLDPRKTRSLDSFDRILKPSKSGSGEADWLHFQISEKNDSLIAIFYLSKVLSLSPSESVELKKVMNRFL